MSRAGRPTETTPDQWVQAALDEIEAAGIQAMAVESVARRLGVSKGGFYHHFKDRRTLLRAALALWEDRFVTDLARRFDAITQPRERLHALLLHATVELEPTVILRLMAAVDDPDVAAALAAAAGERLSLLERTFRELGLSRALGAHRAVMAYSAYLGLAQLRTHAPDALATPACARVPARRGGAAAPRCLTSSHRPREEPPGPWRTPDSAAGRTGRPGPAPRATAAACRDRDQDPGRVAPQSKIIAPERTGWGECAGQVGSSSR